MEMLRNAITDNDFFILLVDFVMGYLSFLPYKMILTAKLAHFSFTPLFLVFFIVKMTLLIYLLK